MATGGTESCRDVESREAGTFLKEGGLKQGDRCEADLLRGHDVTGKTVSASYGNLGVLKSDSKGSGVFATISLAGPKGLATGDVLVSQA